MIIEQRTTDSGTFMLLASDGKFYVCRESDAEFTDEDVDAFKAEARQLLKERENAIT